MANKRQERIYAEKAFALLNIKCCLNEIPEPLDFEILTDTDTFGLEVRQIFSDVEKKFGSRAKENEASNIKSVSSLAKRYYELGGRSVSAKILRRVPSKIDKALIEELAQSMVTNVPIYARSSVTIETKGFQIFLTPLPSEFHCYSHWRFINDKVGWLKPVSAVKLQDAINKKEGPLEKFYKKKYDKIDLLLVADRTFNSGKMLPTDNLIVNNPGFRAIYFMSYPDSIQRIA